MTTKIYTLVFGLLILLFSCSKDGETGPAGAQGPAGTNGSNGTNGTDGVANISSTLFTVSPSSWTSIGSSTYTAVINDNSITNNDSDLVMIYARASATGGWWAIPTQNWFVVGDAMYYKYTGSSITIYYQNTSSLSVSVTYKVVVIPPAMQIPGFDYANYESVQFE